MPEPFLIYRFTSFCSISLQFLLLKGGCLNGFYFSDSFPFLNFWLLLFIYFLIFVVCAERLRSRIPAALGFGAWAFAAGLRERGVPCRFFLFFFRRQNSFFLFFRCRSRQNCFYTEGSNQRVLMLFCLYLF